MQWDIGIVGSDAYKKCNRHSQVIDFVVVRMLQVKEPAKKKRGGREEGKGREEGERERRRIQSREVHVYTIKSLLA